MGFSVILKKEESRKSLVQKTLYIKLKYYIALNFDLFLGFLTFFNLNWPVLNATC